MEKDLDSLLKDLLLRYEIKTIHLEEEFYPYLEATEEGDYILVEGSDLQLETPVLGLLNINFSAWKEDEVERIDTLTPKNSEIGYPLDVNDFTYKKRKQKLERIKEKLGTVAFEGIAFNCAIFSETNEVFKEIVILNSRTLREDASFFFHHLFLVITLSDGSSFAARAWWSSDLLEISFDLFFPTDTGALPKVKYYGAEEGFYLLLPENIDTLKQIKAKFMFLPDVN